MKAAWLAAAVALAAGTAHAEHMAWGTVDSTTATPRLEAGERFFDSMTSNGPGYVQFKLARHVKAIVATCFVDAAGGDAASCTALVLRDRGQTSFSVSLHGIAGETWPDGHLSSDLSYKRTGGHFSVIVYTD